MLIYAGEPRDGFDVIAKTFIDLEALCFYYI